MVCYLNSYQRCLKTSATLFIKKAWEKAHKEQMLHLFNVSCQEKKKGKETVFVKIIEQYCWKRGFTKKQEYYPAKAVMLPNPSEKLEYVLITLLSFDFTAPSEYEGLDNRWEESNKKKNPSEQRPPTFHPGSSSVPLPDSTESQV